MKLTIVFPHVGYCTGYRPHLSTDVKHGATYHIPQCLTYLYSTAIKFVKETKVIDFNFCSFEQNINTLYQYDPDIILVSSTMNSYDNVRKIVENISKKLEYSKIYIGGAAVSSNYHLRPSLLKVDAECEFIVTNKDIFAWTEQVFNQRFDLTFSNFVPTNEWIKDTYSKNIWEKLRYTVITSLGCTFKCNFCLNPKVYQVEFKDLNVLRREIEEMIALYRVSKVSVADPYFFMNSKHAKNVMEVFYDYKIKWSQQTCLITLTDENLELMNQTGCTSVLTGIENFFSQEINKPVSKEKLEERIDRANEFSIKIKPSFISGLLDVDYATDVMQIQYIRSLIERGKIENNQVQANIYTPYIPDRRDRLLKVPFSYWGILPVTAQNVSDWREKLQLCDMINREIFPETQERYSLVKQEYLSHLNSSYDLWFDVDTSLFPLPAIGEAAV